MTVAQPTFADQSVDILGTWDCIVHDPEFGGTETTTYYSDGTVVSIGEITAQLDTYMKVEVSGAVTGTWQIENGIMSGSLTRMEISMLLLNGNDHTRGPIADSFAKSITSLPPFDDTIMLLDSANLTIRDEDGSMTECTRFVGS